MFLHLRDPLVATFNETCALTSRKSEVAQDMSIPKSAQKDKLLRSHSSVFVLEIIASKTVNFWGLFDSEKNCW